MEMTKQERLEKLLNAYSHHYDIVRNVKVEGGEFPAGAIYYLRDENYLITISHGGVLEDAKAVAEQFREHFVKTAVELFSLVPSLVCHGGPGCIVIQTIRK